MGRLERNTFANLFGAAWTAAVGVLCVPLYVGLMGAEAFGLVGLFVMLQSVFVVLDLGVGATFSRELARLDAQGSDARTQRDLAYTLQAVYWVMALLVGVTVFALAPAVARHWVKPQSLSAEEVTTCVRLMGAAMALQFPFAFYQGGLLGLQRQTLFNTLAAATATLRAAGTLLALHFVAPAPQTFFAVQIAAGAAGTGAAALLLWRCLPASGGVHSGFRPELIRRVWRFGAAYAANAVANMALFQGDKIILSTLLPLEMFGYYALAQGVASGMYAVIIAVDGAVFPQLSGLVARGDERELAEVYHRGSQLMAVLLAPIAVVAALFPREVLFAWTGDAAAVENASLVLSLLVAGMLLHGVVQAPYFLQIAHGWWRLILSTNLLLLIAVVPLNILMARAYGGPGAALVWVFLNVCYLLTFPLAHRRFLRGEQGRWLFEDVFLPLAGAFCAGAAARWLMPPRPSRVETLLFLCTTGALAAAVAVSLASRVRASMLTLLRRGDEPFVA
ncbi:MAG TPA: oligosaccharide flippase family protein [Pyrinomonadaceae bacterium]|nr:oligosaccharide flippase family protein [Pyrinomonadaceae bacterium]